MASSVCSQGRRLSSCAQRGVGRLEDNRIFPPGPKNSFDVRRVKTAWMYVCCDMQIYCMLRRDVAKPSGGERDTCLFSCAERTV